MRIMIWNAKQAIRFSLPFQHPFFLFTVINERMWSNESVYFCQQQTFACNSIILNNEKLFNAKYTYYAIFCILISHLDNELMFYLCFKRIITDNQSICWNIQISPDWQRFRINSNSFIKTSIDSKSSENR